MDERDAGPWKVETWHCTTGRVIVLQSDDFHHDVALEITGDFATWEQRMGYAKWLADVLTRATHSAGTESKP